MPLVNRWLRTALLVAVVLPMALACNDDVEDGCPAMERVLEKAESEGRLEPLLRSVTGNGYEIHLEDREPIGRYDGRCFIVYRFRIAGVNRETWEPGPRGLLAASVCGPGGLTLELSGGKEPNSWSNLVSTSVGQAALIALEWARLPAARSR